MNEKSSPLWIVALVGLAGIFRVLSPSVPQGDLPTARDKGGITQSKSSSKGANSALDEIYELLVDHYVIRKDCDKKEKNAPTQIDEVKSVIERSPDLRTEMVGSPLPKEMPDCVRAEAIKRFQAEEGRVLVAMVPDPVDTRIAYRFDETLEAIQTGAQSAGYVLDRFYLPWKPAGQEGTEDDTLFLSRPGAVLFRRSPRAPSSDSNGPKIPQDPLLVFLIGETPTAGIHHRALVNAVELSQELNTLPDVRIVGPNFSGSVKSIQAALMDWASQPSSKSATVRFFGGNTTSPEARQVLNNLKGKSFSTEFYGTVFPDNVTESAIAAYMERLGIPPEQTAVLVESDSSYGQSLLHDDNSRRYRLPYPMQVSQVRTRYHKEATLASIPVSIGNDAKQVSLRLSEDESGSSRDKPEAFAPGPSANLAELSLAAIIDTLRREHIQYVGLFGTDTRDKLFLARLVHSRFKDIHFFTDDSDILYTHPDYTSDLWGMLVFSTYPLLSQQSTWVRGRANLPDGSLLRQFSSQMAESIHNATRIALSDQPQSESKHLMAKNPTRSATDGTALLPGYGQPLRVPTASALPYIWVTVVGSGALWPVSALDPWDEPATRISNDVVNTSYSRSFLVLIVLFSIFCLLSIAFFNAEMYGLRTPLATIFRDVELPPDTHREYLIIPYLAVSGLFGVLFLAFGVMTFVAFEIRVLSFGIIGALLQVLSFVTLILLADSFINALYRVLFIDPLRKRSRLRLLLVELYAALILRIVSFVFWQPTTGLMMLYERATRLSSGVSPLLPFLFLSAGITVWLMWFLKRTQVTLSMMGVQPYPEAVSSASGQGLFMLHTRIKGAMTETYRWSRPGLVGYIIGLVILGLIFAAYKSDLRTIGVRSVIGWAVLCILFGILVKRVLKTQWSELKLVRYITSFVIAGLVFAAYMGDFFRTIEPFVIIGWALFTLFAILVTGILRTLRDFLVVSYQLQRLLHRLAFHRLLPAFERLSPKCARGLSTDLLAAPPALGELQEPHDRLVDLRNGFKGILAEMDKKGLRWTQRNMLDPFIDKGITTTQETFVAELGEAAKSPIKKWGLASSTQSKLSAHARAFFKVLCEYWEGDLLKEVDDKEIRNSVTRQLKRCEDFVAAQIVAHLNAVFVCLRYLIICSIGTLLFLLLAVSCYPYSAQNLMMNSIWVLVVVSSLIFLNTFLVFSRNEVLRAIRTKDGNVESRYRAAITQVILFVILPGLALLSTQFPTLGNLVGSWIGPAMKAMNL
jgi:hypothetical protein